MAKPLQIEPGAKFGKLTYVRDAKKMILPSGQKPRVARCKCECGRFSNVLLLHLVRGRTISCGKCVRQIRKSVLGKRFGTLTITKELSDFTDCGRLFRMVQAECDCGKIIVRRLNCVRNLRSCGCLTSKILREKGLTHGMTRTRIYSIWCNMRNRCYNKKVPNYRGYGAKGIRVCPEWRKSFEAFYSWSMANGYQEHLTIDRFPNKKGNYEPLNCRWATTFQQQNNKTTNVYYAYGGLTKTLAEFCAELGVDYHMVSVRINKLGWSIDQALETQRIPMEISLNKAIKTRYGKDIKIKPKNTLSV